MQNATVGSPGPGGGFAVGDVVEFEDPVLLGLVVGVVARLEHLDHLKRHSLLSEQDPKALMADVIDLPLSHQEPSELAERPGRERQAVILGRANNATLAICASS